jgi:hypothetical protein
MLFFAANRRFISKGYSINSERVKSSNRFEAARLKRHCAHMVQLVFVCLIVFFELNKSALSKGVTSNGVQLYERNLSPNLEVRSQFDYVRDDVLAETQKMQQPFSYESLPGNEDFYFVQI